MRQPTLIGRVDGDPARGLSQVLAGGEPLADAVVSAEVGGERALDVLLAGPIPPNSAELLESPRMAGLLREARTQYDLVVLDTPPTVVSDAIPLIPQVSGVLVVTRLRRSRKDAARDLSELLGNLDALVLGTVANDATPAREGYYMPYAVSTAKTS